MKVNVTNGIQRLQQAYSVNVQRAGQSLPSKAKATPPHSGGLLQDQVSISPLGQEIQKIRNQIASEPGLREEKIAAIRRLIANGEYGVSDELLAEKIVQYFLSR